MTVKDQLRRVLENLPEDATLDDAIERLILVSKIDEGIKQLDEGKGIPQDEVFRQLRVKWAK